jgi:hypothetical protein
MNTERATGQRHRKILCKSNSAPSQTENILAQSPKNSLERWAQMEVENVGWRIQ